MKKETKDNDPCAWQEQEEAAVTMHLPIRDALDVISGRWKLQIMYSLKFGTSRFKQLLRDIPGLTPKMLSKELKELELHQLAERRVYDTMPVRIEYHLTPYGKTLSPVIRELHKWGAAHRKKIIRNTSE